MRNATANFIFKKKKNNNNGMSWVKGGFVKIKGGRYTHKLKTSSTQTHICWIGGF